MKKVTLLAAFFIIIGVNADATPLLNQATPLTIESVSYTITDRSDGTDTWQDPNGYTGSDYTGIYLGTIAGNDSTADLENLIGWFLDNSSYTITSYEKREYDDSDGSWSFDGGTEGLVSVSTADFGVSGTWAVTSPYTLDFYTVKGAEEFALYYVNPALSSGEWVTRHILNGGGNAPAISHFTASIAASTPVPEPATMLLFGTGLVGLAGARLRKKKR